ncbi:putative hypoxia- inducible factor prolyl hydroxylase (phd2) [Besnoitia besnoiti]|uniref:Putative hypoxia-inducible factor prolyl hydroxylase (Phd2) n=1 Tax=Besnoitia besnoiti TaxID=94643 RepID=A0A2A9MIR0_BESBE|nr:putative hypoxia- inducible factor prolyl hydroxylase (phd2) [Besnoitia besnoiti]PFH37084.1 putative hypoxia- inducible factor prolyl hydroxylase (phd2) [Besnoitia besnoiti]
MEGEQEEKPDKCEVGGNGGESSGEGAPDEKQDAGRLKGDANGEDDSQKAKSLQRESAPARRDAKDSPPVGSAAKHASPQSSSKVPVTLGPSVLWDKDVEDAFVAACLKVLNYSTRKDLERRTRSGTGTEDKGRHDGCCPPVTASGSAQPCKHLHGSSHSACSSARASSSSSSAATEGATACCTGSPPHGRCKAKAASPDAPSQAVEKPAEAREESAESPAASYRGVPLPPVYRFQKDADDHLGALLDEWTGEEKLRQIAAEVTERAALVYDNVRAKGEAEGLELGVPEEKQLRQDVLKEALVREIHARINSELRRERLRDCREGGLLANPNGYRDGPLSYLANDTIRDLMKEGVAVQRGFLGEAMRKKIWNEIELLEYDGRFNEVFSQTLHDLRKDYMCWMSSSDLDRENQQGLWQLFKAMQALPFELNKKASLCLQVSWVFQMAMFRADGAYYKKHIDAGYDPALDNGRKVTAIYYPNAPDWKEKDGGALRVYPRRRKEQQLSEGSAAGSGEAKAVRDIAPAGDVLVLLRSRDMPHEVLPCHRKRFAITLWMTGPAGPGDDV